MLEGLPVLKWVKGGQGHAGQREKAGIQGKGRRLGSRAKVASSHILILDCNFP